MELTIEKLIEALVREVVLELSRRNINITPGRDEQGFPLTAVTRKELGELVNLSDYKTPLLTERQMASLGPEIKEVVLPKGTVITPGARQIIAKRKLIVTSNPKTN